MWKLVNSDPHEAASGDDLHMGDSGLFGHHLWKETKQVVESMPGSQAATQIDNQLVFSL